MGSGKRKPRCKKEVREDCHTVEERECGEEGKDLRCRTVQERHCSPVKERRCSTRKQLECRNEFKESCNDKKNGYHGFTRTCRDVPVRKCEQKPVETCETVSDTRCTYSPK